MPWREIDKKVINPYAFVLLPDKKRKASKEKGTLTGKIVCSLYPRTPLFIPNTTYDKMFSGGAVAEHKSYDFFSYNDISKETKPTIHEPIIPGSSIRGEVRSLYETLTGSCLSGVSENLVLHKRTPESRELGILTVKKRGGENAYSLTRGVKKYMACYKECSRDNSDKFFNGKRVGKYFSNENLRDMKEGSEVWFKGSGKRYISTSGMKLFETVDEIYTNNPKDRGLDRGLVLKGAPFGTKKHHFSIAKIPSDTIEGFHIEKEDVDSLFKVIELYKDNDNNSRNKWRYEEYEKTLKGICNCGGSIPVYYKEYENHKTLYLSPSCITKEVYQNTISTLLRKDGGFDPCSNTEDSCPACKLFGMVGEGKNAISGRIRFSDARLLELPEDLTILFERPMTIKELSSPKISSTEFYLRAPNAQRINGRVLKPVSKQSSHPIENGAHMWNYDFASNWDKGKAKIISGINGVPRISGRKFYWQHVKFSWDGVIATKGNGGQREPDKNKRNNTIRPIKPCKKQAGNNNPDYAFRFTVFFERLTEDELDKLISVISLGENGYHAIGHGKPLGMGSAEIEIDSVNLRKLSIENGQVKRDTLDTKRTPKSLSEAFGKDGEGKKDDELVYIAKQVEVISKLHDFSANPTYPVAVDKKGIAQIFNWFVANRGNINNPKIKQVLSEIPTDDNGVEDKVGLKEYEWI